MRYGPDAVKERTAKVDMTGIDLTVFDDHPLAPNTLRCVQAMHDVEHHTICYLRDLLITPAHRDPEVTTFLTMWAYEEFWHGEALGQILKCHGLPEGGARTSALRATLGWRDRVRPLAMWATSFIGPDLIAVVMAWGAINEWTTQAAYGRLATRSGHPVLQDVLHRVMRQEGRHIDFYAAQATTRLASSPRAQRITRHALKRLWSPVGSGLLSEHEMAFLQQHLFSGSDAEPVLRRIDHHIDHLPGLSGLRLLGDLPKRYIS